jgi:hypothetical protein
VENGVQKGSLNTERCIMWPFTRKKRKDCTKSVPGSHPPTRRWSDDGIDPLTLCPYGVFVDDGDDRSRRSDDPAPVIEPPAVEAPAPTETASSSGGSSFTSSDSSSPSSYDAGSSSCSYDSGASSSGGGW